MNGHRGELWRLTARSIRIRPVRFALTCTAVVLGVAFVVGALTLTGTIRAGFDDLFADLSAGTDVQVRAQSNLARQGVTFRRRIPSTLTALISATPGVVAAVPRTQGVAYLVGDDNKVVGGGGETGPDPIAASWPSDRRVSPFRLVTGHAPANGQLVVDVRSARDGRLRVGSRARVLTKGVPEMMTIAGLVRFGSADSPAGTPVLLFSANDAERLLGTPGQVDSIDLVVADGASTDAVIGRLNAELPAGVQAVDGAQVTRERQSGAQSRLRFFTAFLLLFAALSLVVGAFLIANTFAITVSQRTRELALLRALGAQRAQIVRLVLGESFVVGTVASALGIGAGIAIAVGLRAALRAAGLELPSGPTRVTISTVIIGALIGVVTTMLAAIAPSWRAGRVAPLAALRDSEAEQPSARIRTIVGALVMVVGAVELRQGALLPSLGLAGAGTALLFLGIVMAAPFLAQHLTWWLGGPITRLSGITGVLARQNSRRNPRRTAITAMALTVAAAVSCFAVVLGASFKASLTTAVSGGIRGDYVVRGGGFGFGGLPPSLAARIAVLPEVAASTGVRYGFANVSGPKRKAVTRVVVARVGARPIAAFDARVADRLLDVGLLRGRLADLGPGRIGVSQKELDEKGWRVGDTLTLTFPQGTTKARIVTSFRNSLAFDFAMSIDAMASLVPDQFDFVVYVKTGSGVAAAQAKAALERATADVPLAKVLDQSQFTAGLTQSVDQLFTLIVALMGFAVAIAVMGIAITLTLTVHERTRELGLLRAVGMSRAQARAVIRWESIIISVFATVLGIGLGVVAGWGLTRALRSEGLGELRIPITGIGALVMLSVVAGVAAAVIPARRAASVDVLAAIAQS